MRFSKLCVVLTVALVLLLCLNADAAKQRRTELDIKTPLSKILTSLGKLIANFKLVMFVEAILGILNCLPQSTPPPVEEIFKIGKVIDISAMPFTPEMKEVKLTSIKPLLSEEDITEYCNSAPFAEIHNYVWVEDKEAEDLLRFFYRFGYPNAYQVIPAIYAKYKCDPELIKTLPNEPTASQTLAKKSNIVTRNNSFIREQISHSLQKREVQADCDILGILMKLLQSGALDLLGLLQNIITEFSTNPSLHFLVGKIQEPIKGDSFRNFRSLEPVRHLLYKAHQALIKDDNIRQILTAVKELTGIDLIETNFLETIVGVVEMILWRNTNPLPPYYPPPTPEPTTEDSAFEAHMRNF